MTGNEAGRGSWERSAMRSLLPQKLCCTGAPGWFQQQTSLGPDTNLATPVAGSCCPATSCSSAFLVALACCHFFSGPSFAQEPSWSHVSSAGCWAAFLTTPRDVVEAKAGVQMQSTCVKYKVCSLWEHLSQLGMLPRPLLCPGCVFGWAVALRGNS